jgi:tetratricopeptide (TPR) repeat protein
MALDREKTFANAERLLKQGKTGQALEECKRLADDAPKDLLMLNRLGDFLARSNRGADAIVYYQMIADQFSASGFYPKAIAILKKIVKVDPGHLKSIVHLGELNLKQKLPGEARTWFLQAAEGYLRAREFAKAREVYEKLVVAEPDNVNHVVRLAEARAAEGDPERAGLELIALGKRMLAGGRTEDAERTFKRASELLPNRAESVVGLARCQVASGKLEEGLRLADEAWEKAESSGAVAGELFVLFESVGDVDRAERLLLDPKADAIVDDSIEEVFRTALTSGGVEGVWSRVVPLIDRWTRAHQFDRSVRLLERIARIEDKRAYPRAPSSSSSCEGRGTRRRRARAVEGSSVCTKRRARRRRSRRSDDAEMLDPSPAFVPRRATVNAAPQALAARPGRCAALGRVGGAALGGRRGTASFGAPAVPLGPADLGS